MIIKIINIIKISKILKIIMITTIITIIMIITGHSVMVPFSSFWSKIASLFDDIFSWPSLQHL